MAEICILNETAHFLLSHPDHRTATTDARAWAQQVVHLIHTTTTDTDVEGFAEKIPFFNSCLLLRKHKELGQYHQLVRNPIWLHRTITRLFMVAANDVHCYSIENRDGITWLDFMFLCSLLATEEPTTTTMRRCFFHPPTSSSDSATFSVK